MKPVDVKTFLEDNTVQEIIESTKATVKVDDETGDGLTGRDRRIEGLKNDKYYMVEKEINPDGSLVNESYYPAYVTDYPGIGPGGVYDDLGLITRISGGSINGLINSHTYTVRAAVPFANDRLPYTDGNGTAAKQITGGVVDIGGIDGTGSLDLSSVFLTETYEVIAVSADNSPNSWFQTSRTISSWGSFKLEGPDTEVDYVFVKKDDPSVFKVLRVKIGQEIQTGIKITLTFTSSEKTTISSTSAAIAIGSLDGSNTAALTLNISGGSVGNIEWYYNDASIPIQTGGMTLSLSNNTANINYLVVGTHIFTVFAETGGTPYSASFTLTVTEK